MLLLPPLLLPPWNVQRRDISREAHLAPWSPQLLQKTEFCNVSLAILQSPVHKWAKCRMRGGEKEIYEAASAHFNNEAAFSIFHPSVHPSSRAGERANELARVFTFNYPRIHHPFDPPLFDVGQFASESRFALAEEENKEEGAQQPSDQLTNQDS